MRRKRLKSGKERKPQIVGDMMIITEEAMLEEMQNEADREGRRVIMLQQAADGAERQQLENIFAVERVQAAQALMQMTAEQEAAVRQRCSELKIATVDRTKALRKSTPTLVHKGVSSLQSRNWPAQIHSHDAEVIVTWAARNVMRATRYANVLPGVFPSKIQPSPFRGPQRLHSGAYPAASRQQSKLAGPEMIVFDSSTSTHLTRSRLVSRESSRSEMASSRDWCSNLASRESSRNTISHPAVGVRSVSPVLDEELYDALHSTSQESIIESPGTVERLFAMSPQNSSHFQRAPIPYHRVASGLATHHIPGTSPVLVDNPLCRRVSSCALQLALAASLSAHSSIRPGDTLTSNLHKTTYWDQAAKDMVHVTELAALAAAQGELYTAANVSATMAKAQIAATKRELMKSVELPSGSALGVMGRDRPVTAHESRDLRTESKRLLSWSPSLRSHSSQSVDRIGEGSRYHSRHQTFQMRTVPMRRGSQTLKNTHYNNVRLRTVISFQMDRVIYGDGATHTHEILLGHSITQLAANDATSVLSFFPGVLEVLFGVLDTSASHESRVAVAEGLACISRQAAVQEVLISGKYVRHNAQERFLKVLMHLMSSCSSAEVQLVRHYGAIVANLCATEDGFHQVDMKSYTFSKVSSPPN